MSDFIRPIQAQNFYTPITPIKFNEKNIFEQNGMKQQFKFNPEQQFTPEHPNVQNEFRANNLDLMA